MRVYVKSVTRVRVKLSFIHETATPQPDLFSKLNPTFSPPNHDTDPVIAVDASNHHTATNQRCWAPALSPLCGLEHPGCHLVSTTQKSHDLAPPIPTFYATVCATPPLSCHRHHLLWPPPTISPIPSAATESRLDKPTDPGWLIVATAIFTTTTIGSSSLSQCWPIALVASLEKSPKNHRKIVRNYQKTTKNC